MKFEELGIIEPILKALKEEGYENPSPIQEEAIPYLLQKKDLLGCAQTGTGKTAAFAIPILQWLFENPQKGKAPIRALILTPTRELALQIEESFTVYGKYLHLRCCSIFGGVAQKPQLDNLRKGVDVVVATPGRFLDLHTQGFIQLKDLEFFVLDEADRMLDMGFVHDIKKVMKLLPAKRQNLLFSATMPTEVKGLVNSILQKYITITVSPVSSTVDTIEQSLYYVDKGNKLLLLIDLLKQEPIDSALVFSRTKHGADKIVKKLTKANIKAQAIHGDKSQGARQLALKKFKGREIKVLVATDIAARGIDIDDLSHVFNYDIPNIPETYVHRIGRTGRAGHSGKAISFCMFEEIPFLKDIEKLIGKKIPVVEGHNYPLLITEIPEKQEPKTQKKKKTNQVKAKTRKMTS
ncbi:MAG: DEAD/DEAH box helicase [Acetivibrio sp.]